MKAARVRALIQADINLFAYHSALDCHPLHGNNAALGRLMGIEAPEALDPKIRARQSFGASSRSR